MASTSRSLKTTRSKTSKMQAPYASSPHRGGQIKPKNGNNFFLNTANRN